MPGIWEAIRGNILTPIGHGARNVARAALPNNPDGTVNMPGAARTIAGAFIPVVGAANMVTRFTGQDDRVNNRLSRMLGGGDRQPAPRINAIRAGQAADRLSGVPRNENRIRIERDQESEQRDPRINQQETERGGGSAQQRGAGLLGASQRFGSLMDFNDMYEAQRRRADAER